MGVQGSSIWNRCNWSSGTTPNSFCKFDKARRILVFVGLVVLKRFQYVVAELRDAAASTPSLDDATALQQLLQTGPCQRRLTEMVGESLLES